MVSILKKIWSANIKLQMIAVLLIFGAAGSISLHSASTVPRMAIGVIVAVALDYLAILIKTRRSLFSTSAVITGLIISMVLAPDAGWYIVAFAAATAIASKHLIRVWGRHIFNPAAFGLLVSVIVFKTYLHWWGGAVFWLVLVLGGLLAVRFKRLHLVISFAVAQWIVLGVIALLKGQSPLNAVWMTNMFFLFVMLVEPKTSPIITSGRIIFGAAAGILFAIYLSAISGFDPAILTLLSANILVPAIGRWWKR